MSDDKLENNQDYGEVFFRWQFPEFPKYERGQNWYIKAGVVVAILLVYSVITFNFLFGFLTIIASLIVLIFHRSDNEVEFRITEDGILVNKNFFDYKEIKNFYIIYQPPEVKTLYFEPKSIFKPRIPIDLVDQDPVKIREVLKRYLDEDLEREHEPVSDQTSRMFKL